MIASDDSSIVSLLGKRPQESKGSIVRVAVDESQLLPTQWGMQLKKAHGSTVRLSIMSSAKAIIGRYEVFIETKRKNVSEQESLFRYKHEEEICVLFNAWCSGNL